MSRLSDYLSGYDARLEEPLWRLNKASNLTLMVNEVWEVIRILAICLLEEVLSERARQAQTWPLCPVCRRPMHSKGLRQRELRTLFGVIAWRRPVGRCPGGCKTHQVAPLDEALGVLPYQQTQAQIQSMGCLLTVFMAYETASQVLRQLTGVSLAVSTLWNWVERVGQRAMEQTNDELQAMAAGKPPQAEPLPAGLEAATLAIGADGVMVPFRPTPGTPKGATRWREVKVAVFARLGEWVNRKGESIPRLCQRRLVAVLGSIDEFAPRLWLEAVRQQVRTAVRVVWLSDGGTGLWSVFQRNLKPLGAIAILDFYHAAQNLYKGASAWLDGRTRLCQKWFAMLRHRLRHGQEQQVLTELAALVEKKTFPESGWQVLCNLYQYLKSHEAHIHYEQFKAACSAHWQWHR
ncbi:MAG: ISKra4 family transposase [Betaproteobacteria bacterium]|nr:ISKra4 family transposase [Betaproteobacteria bacterium]